MESETNKKTNFKDKIEAIKKGFKINWIKM